MILQFLILIVVIAALFGLNANLWVALLIIAGLILYMAARWTRKNQERIARQNPVPNGSEMRPYYFVPPNVKYIAGQIPDDDTIYPVHPEISRWAREHGIHSVEDEYALKQWILDTDDKLRSERVRREGKSNGQSKSAG